MYHFNVNFLYAVSKAEMRYTDFHVSRAIHLTAIFAGQGDDFHAFGTRGFNRLDDVSGGTGSRETTHHVPLLATRFHGTGENMVKAEIVTDEGDMADVSNSDCRVARAIFT